MEFYMPGRLITGKNCIKNNAGRLKALGSRCLMVENYTEIVAFSENCVRLDSAGGPLCVYGSGLCLNDIRSGALVIRGGISRLELPCKGGDSAD